MQTIIVVDVFRYEALYTIANDPFRYRYLTYLRLILLKRNVLTPPVTANQIQASLLAFTKVVYTLNNPNTWL